VTVRQAHPVNSKDRRPRPKDTPPPTGTVEAAGVLLWRRGPDGLEVLMVRSAKHGEWGWPKGRREPGETLPECAVRETVEETGFRPRLGVPLGRSGYLLPDGRPKVVHYCAARSDLGVDGGADGGADGAAPVPPAEAAGEIAELAWVPVARAADRLSFAEHHLPLEELVGLEANGRLDSRPILVLRHASARSRQAWAGSDADRPLSGKGRRQAAALPGLIGCWQPTRLISSPWQRCVDTVTPFATATGCTLVTDRGLSESGHRSAPPVAAARVEELIAGGDPALLCTHRPVLGAVLGAVEGHATPGVATGLPTDDPYLRPAELLVAHVVRDPDGSHGGWGGYAVAAVERHRPVRS
jgi:8-oxo-(d)GTP phosphatase